MFWDIDNIKPGQDFVDVIDSTLDKCPIVVIVIGHRWLVTERNGARRLEDPSDFHRLEIERALQRKAYVVPALVGGAQMPSVDALPPSLRALTRRNAFELTDRGFSHDAKKLIEVIDRALVVIGDKASTQLSKADAAKDGLAAASTIAAGLLGAVRFKINYRSGPTDVKRTRDTSYAWQRVYSAVAFASLKRIRDDVLNARVAESLGGFAGERRFEIESSDWKKFREKFESMGLVTVEKEASSRGGILPWPPEKFESMGLGAIEEVLSLGGTLIWSTTKLGVEVAAVIVKTTAGEA